MQTVSEGRESMAESCWSCQAAAKIRDWKSAWWQNFAATWAIIPFQRQTQLCRYLSRRCEPAALRRVCPPERSMLGSPSRAKLFSSSGNLIDCYQEGVFVLSAPFAARPKSTGPRPNCKVRVFGWGTGSPLAQISQFRLVDKLHQYWAHQPPFDKIESYNDWKAIRIESPRSAG